MPDSGTNSYAPQNFAWKVSGGAGAPLERSGAPLERAGAPEEAGDSPWGTWTDRSPRRSQEETKPILGSPDGAGLAL